MPATDIAVFGLKVQQQYEDIFHGTVEECFRSVVEGSEITGAPGQPVDTGYLRASWNTKYESRSAALISTNASYAPDIEDNARGATLRSKIGGWHSVKMTRAAFQRIADYATRMVKGGV